MQVRGAAGLCTARAGIPFDLSETSKIKPSYYVPTSSYHVVLGLSRPGWISGLCTCLAFCAFQQHWRSCEVGGVGTTGAGGGNWGSTLYLGKKCEETFPGGSARGDADFVQL